MNKEQLLSRLQRTEGNLFWCPNELTNNDVEWFKKEGYIYQGYADWTQTGWRL